MNDTCKHNWHFIGESSRLRCQRCKQETGPWTTEQLTVPTDMHLSIANIKPNYNISFHNNLDTGGAGKQVGKLDFNGPEMVFEGDAAESARVFMDCIAQAFRGRLEQERAAEREACAKILDEMADDMEREMEPSTAVAYVRSKAAAIRARGERP